MRKKEVRNQFRDLQEEVQRPRPRSAGEIRITDMSRS